MEKSALTVLMAWMLSFTAFSQPSDPSVMLLKEKRGTEATRSAAFHRSQGATPIYLKHVGWSIIKLPAGHERRLGENYRKSGLFEKCESNRVYRAFIIPNDPLYPLWGLQKIQAERGWDAATSNNVVVAVIDTGVDFDHPDIAANLWTGPNGEHGYTASGGALTPGGKDDHFHGTHVAGILGAVGNNSVGVAGIAWRTLILSLKFLNSQGWGYTADAALCIDRMIELKLAGHNIRVSNNSWGTSGLDAVLEDAFRAAEEAGILSVCAAGNDASNTDIEPFTPATLPVDGIISVVASDINDDKAYFSNYGSSTDLMAPGLDILSLDTNGGYRTLSGTSMASPHVAGVAAAIFGLNGSLTVAQTKNILLNPDSLDQTAFLETSTFGGRLNMGKALNNGLIYAPPNNRPPTISVTGSPLALRAGESGTLTASATDPDGDSLRYTVLLHVTSDTLGQVYPIVFVPTNRITVTNFARAIALGLEATFSVSDGKGGSARASGKIFMEENPALVRPVTASLSISPIPVHPFWELFVASDSSNASASLFFSSYQYIDGANCCYPANMGTPLYRGLQQGPNVFRAYVWDHDGNFTNSQRLLVDNGDTGIHAPEAKVSLNRIRGTAPLSVTADFSASDSGLTYISRLWNRQSGSSRSSPFADVQKPVQTFALTNLGVTAVEFIVHDSATSVSDKVVQLFTVLPSGPTMAVARYGEAITVNWTQAQPTDVLEASMNLASWFPVRTGLPPATITLTGQRAFFRVRQ